MWVDYGGVSLKVIDLKRYERENIYTDDRADLLYVRQTLGFAAEYSPGGVPRYPSAVALSPDVVKRLKGEDDTAAILSKTPRGVAPAPFPFTQLETDAPGFERTPPSTWRSGPETDAEIQQKLMLPRQKLILWAYDRQTGEPIRWLESPRPGFVVDATTGPLPLSCDVISVRGDPNSVGVYFQIQTDVSPCPTGSDRFVLSHRWTMNHSYDEDYFLTRTTEGTIVFHAGVRDLIGTNPDYVRNQFILPIPLGFRRVIRSITMSPDGTTLRYVVDDTDPKICFSAGDSGATQISIIEQCQYTAPGAAQLFNAGGSFSYNPEHSNFRNGVNVIGDNLGLW